MKRLMISTAVALAFAVAPVAGAFAGVNGTLSNSPNPATTAAPDSANGNYANSNNANNGNSPDSTAHMNGNTGTTGSPSTGPTGPGTAGMNQSGQPNVNCAPGAANCNNHNGSNSE
jgi:hypothetical protein